MSIEIQKQVKDNAKDVQNYVKDLYEWENEMNSKKQQNKEKLKQSIKQQDIKQKKSDNPGLKRDQNTIQEYYKNWDKFDVEQELEEIDQPNYTIQQQQKKQVNFQQGQNKPRSKISIKGGRGQSSDLQVLKDKGILSYESCEYQQALEYFTQCLDKIVDEQNNEFKSNVLSNRAQTYLKLGEFSLAEKDCTQSIQLNDKNVKSLYRRAMVNKKLGKLQQAISDLQQAELIEPANNEIIAQLKFLKEKDKLERKQMLQSLVISNKDDSQEFKLTQVKDV